MNNSGSTLQTTPLFRAIERPLIPPVANDARRAESAGVPTKEVCGQLRPIICRAVVDNHTESRSSV
jgi:hypothetical protein